MTDSGFTGDMDAPPDVGTSTERLLAAPEMWDEPPHGLDDRILAQIESEAAPLAPLVSPEPEPTGGRHWPSMMLGAAAAVLVVFVALIGFSVLDGSEGNEVLAVDLTPTGVVPDVSGSVEMEETGSGVRIDLRAVGLPRRIDGAYYEAWLRTSTGELIPVGTFHDGVDVVLWGGVAMAEVEAFSITQERVESRDESGRESSGAVVLKADIPVGP